jgi:hypothetical protein
LARERPVVQSSSIALVATDVAVALGRPAIG